MTNAYEIFCGNRFVAMWDGGELRITDAARVPLYLKRTGDFAGWLAFRAIDRHRTNARLLKKALRLTEKDDAHISLSVNGATITDNCWVRPVDSALCYADVKFTDDSFASLALRGDYDSFSATAQCGKVKTPQLTAIGSFEKCWKLENGEWWLYKQANKEELFSELFICRLGEKLGFSMAHYEQCGDYIKTRDFTEGGKYNFEPASAFADSVKDYPAVISALNEICPQAIPDYIQMLFFDAVCCNVDRHKNNFGLLRDAETGEYIGLAPNFDNNLALIARSHYFISGKGVALISRFCELLFAHPEYEAHLPKVEMETVQNTADEIDISVNKNFAVNQVFSRYTRIMKSIHSMDGKVAKAPLPSDDEMDAAFPPFLKESLQAMRECNAKLARGEECYRSDCIADDLQGSINIAEVDGLISTDIAWYLREKHLGLRKEDIKP